MEVSNGIRVLFVTNYKQLYGANHSLLQMILELREKGVVPTVLLPPEDTLPDNDLEVELDCHGIPYVETPVRLDKHRDWKKVVANYFLAIICREKAYAAVRDLGFDLIHSNSSTMSVGAYIARKLKKPHIWHLREFGDLDYGLKTPFGKWFQKKIYGGNNTFIAISKKIKEHYKKFIGLQKIKLVYNGIKPSPKRVPELKDRVDFCIVGLIHPQKGHMELLEAANELVNSRNIRNIHINIIGSGYQPYIDSLSKYIKDMKLTEYVTMLGRRNDVPELLTKMDVGVMASSHEAFGRVTVEYMMAGLPVIASDGGANTEIIENEVSGLIYKSGDPQSLADKMALLASDSDLRQSYGENGSELAEKKFSSKANSDAVYNIYKEILHKG